MKKIISLILLVAFGLSFILKDYCLASDINNVDKFHKDRLNWAYRAYKLQYMQHYTPEDLTKEQKGPLVVTGTTLILLGLLTAVNYSDDENTNYTFPIGLCASGATLIIYSGSLLNKYTKKKKEWDALYNEGISKGYIVPGEVSIKNIVREANYEVIIFESLSGIVGPAWAFIDILIGTGMSIEGFPYYQIMILVLCVMAYPFSIPYGVYSSGKYLYQGGTYGSAFIGGLAAGLSLYLLLSSDNEFSYDDTVFCYLGTVAGSVLSYNLKKPRPRADITVSKNFNLISPRIYLSRNPFNNQLMINAQLMNIRF